MTMACGASIREGRVFLQLLCWQLLRKIRPQVLYLPLFQNTRLKALVESQRSTKKGEGGRYSQLEPKSVAFPAGPPTIPKPRDHSPLATRRCFSKSFRMNVYVMCRGVGGNLPKLPQERNPTSLSRETENPEKSFRTSDLHTFYSGFSAVSSRGYISSHHPLATNRFFCPGKLHSIRIRHLVK